MYVRGVVHLRIGFERDRSRADVPYLHPVSVRQVLCGPVFYFVHHGKDGPLGQSRMVGDLFGQLLERNRPSRHDFRVKSWCVSSALVEGTGKKS